MRKVISDVVNFPNGCETVRFTACFVSMLMRAEKMVDQYCDFFCGDQEGPCIRCGKCGDFLPIHRKHEELYNLYNAVSGFAFMQMDLSDDRHMGESWSHTVNMILSSLDDYVGFAMDYAGYSYEEICWPEVQKELAFEKIKALVDREIPVLAYFGKKYEWVLVTGYDGKQALYGFDGSQGYWGSPAVLPAGYEDDGLFVMPDWYEKGGCAILLGEKKAPAVSMDDMLKRAVFLMEKMREHGYYRNSVRFMRDDSRFADLSDQALLGMRDRIAGWIGQPIDQRAMLGEAVKQLCAHKELTRKILFLNRIHELCWQTHDVLWVPWRGIGEYMEGDRITWAKGLRNKSVRNMVAGCMEMVCNNDDRILEYCKKAYQND